jgi:hypothetical protein
MFCESCYELEYNKDIDLVVQKENQTFQNRRENWNITHFGKYGLEEHDSKKINSKKPQIIIFGDSYVEAYMIPWEQRLQNQINNTNINMFGVGISGIGSPEFYELIKHYKSIFHNSILNIILLTNVNDIFPQKSNSFLDIKPQLRSITSRQRLTKIEYKFKLFSFYRLRKTLGINHLNFSIIKKQKIESKITKKINNSNDLNYYWDEMLEAMKSNSPYENLLFVYVPTVPRIHHNKLDFIDDSSDVAMAFQKACKEKNVGFINLQDNEIQYYLENKSFCRGFPLSRPGEGHCNADGHRLIAQAIEEYINQCNLLK